MGSQETHLKFLSFFVPPADFVSETSDVAQGSLRTSGSAGRLSSNQEHHQCSWASRCWCGAKKIREGRGKQWQLDRQKYYFIPCCQAQEQPHSPLSMFLNAAHSPPLKEIPNGWISYTGHLY